MATNGNAWAQQSDTHNAEVLRGFAAAVFGLPMASHANSAAAVTTRMGSYGVIGGPTALQVTSTGGLGWSVNEGYVVAPGTFAKGQGAYVGYNNTAATGTLAANSAFIRHDLICYRARDTDVDGSGSEDDSIVVLQGSVASTDPSVAASVGSLVVLARAVVPATSGTPTFTDLRQRATAIGGIRVCTSATRPTSTALYEGLAIFETDTDSIYLNVSATTTADWRLIWAASPAWTAATPSGAWTNLGAGYHVLGYRKVQDDVQVRGTVTGGTSGSQIYTLPVGFRPTANYQVPGRDTAGFCYVEIGSDGGVTYFGSNSAAVSVDFQISTI